MAQKIQKNDVTKSYLRKLLLLSSTSRPVIDRVQVNGTLSSLNLTWNKFGINGAFIVDLFMMVVIRCAIQSGASDSASQNAYLDMLQTLLCRHSCRR